MLLSLVRSYFVKCILKYENSKKLTTQVDIEFLVLQTIFNILNDLQNKVP